MQGVRNPEKLTDTELQAVMVAGVNLTKKAALAGYFKGYYERVAELANENPQSINLQSRMNAKALLAVFREAEAASRARLDELLMVEQQMLHGYEAVNKVLNEEMPPPLDPQRDM